LAEAMSIESGQLIMKPLELVDLLASRFHGLVAKSSWGETALFYNPSQLLPSGVYVATVKEHDGDNDRASQLDRPGIYRFSVGIGNVAYGRRFGVKPARPLKGEVVATGHDFTAVDVVLPHPVYAWMGWISILSPSSESIRQLWPDIEVGYALAQKKYSSRRPKIKNQFTL
tara:strand:+ start:2703 stop:3215 length:513 start_codon:yes stop_codon:yes gene_type:complete